MKKLLLLTLLFSPALVFTQQINLNSSMGVSVGSNNKYKQLMLSRSLYLAYEKRMNKNLFLTLGLGTLNYQHNSSDNGGTYFQKTNFLTTPICVKRIFPLTKLTEAYYEFGVSVTYNLSNKKIYDGLENQNKSQLGFGVSGIGNVGARTMFAPLYWVDFSIGNQLDLINSSSKLSQFYKTNTYYFKLGICRML